ncbi:hypothetical protein [Rikenella microfusus]|uniref:Mu-like prophage protein gp16 n=1 Tax=Rikenella microfusus TaxID=28139 RepID=A0A379MPK7_9BACT|nr:hypothetical protein [Rikenella microfusus]SUE33654.1 Uncharacterised protein [Rikenella microfusus]
MKTYRDGLLGRLHKLIRERGIDDDTKREMYASYGVTTAADMTDYQLGHLCSRLEGREVGPAPVIRPRQDTDRETRGKKISTILNILARHGIVERKEPLPAVVRFAEVNDFVRRYSRCHKPLSFMTPEELDAFHKVLRAMEARGWKFAGSPASPTTDHNAAPAVVFVTTPNDNPIIN